MRMRALVLHGTDSIANAPLRLEEREVPTPGPNEVLVRLSVAAICRTDLHIIEGELPLVKRPLIPGHQGVGTIVGLGSSCTRLRVGQRVGIAWLRSTCGVCEFCLSGRENLCERQTFTGYHADGVFAEYTVVPEDFAYLIPEALKDETAVPLLCAGIIGYRSLKRSLLPERGGLAIFGFGSSAHIILQVARAHGARVYVVTRGERHQNLAREMGAEWVGETIEGFPVKVESAILFAPAGELVPQALSVLKRGGTLALAGIYMSEIPALNYEESLFYERNLHSVTANTRRDGRELLEEAVAVRITPHVARYRFEDANRALLDLKRDQIAGTGVLVFSDERGYLS